MATKLKAEPSAFEIFANKQAKKKRPRVVGSCRFSPYYKAQWYDVKAVAWRDISERFATKDAARKVFTDDKEWRLMVVTMKGRSVL